MQISGQESPDTIDLLLSEQKWEYASTELRHAERVKQAIAARGLTDVVDVLFILSVIDGHGLFHRPIPAPKQRSKDIRRAATAAANRLRRRMMRIRSGKISAADERERRLAEEWPRLGPAAFKMEEEKIRCATYQTMRGGWMVPVGAYANRMRETRPPRAPDRPPLHYPPLTQGSDILPPINTTISPRLTLRFPQCPPRIRLPARPLCPFRFVHPVASPCHSSSCRRSTFWVLGH